MWEARNDLSEAQAVASAPEGPLRDKSLGHPRPKRQVGPNGKPDLFDGERQFRLLVSGVRDYALYMLDPNGTVASWNAGAQRIKGYASEEIVGQHFSRFYTDAERAAGIPMRSLRTAAEQGRFEAEAQRVRKDGSPFWANVVIQPLYDESGVLVGFAKITRDITERHQNEERLRAEVAVRSKAEIEARAARERLLDAIDCINDGFTLYDADDRLLLHNRRYLEMHEPVGHLIAPGVSFEALVRAGLDDGDGLQIFPTEAQVQARLTWHRQANGIPHIQRRGETWLMSSERRTREGGVVLIETDITQLKIVEAAKDQFLAMVSHELRTPLTPIHGALALIGSGKLAELPDSVASLIQVASRNCERLMSIVNDLLDVTRISIGTFSLASRRTVVVPFLEQIVDNKRIGPEARDIELSIDPRAMDIEIDADPLRIQQVLDNILSNAIKFADPDAPISVTIERHDEWLRISVVDRGQGIAKGSTSGVRHLRAGGFLLDAGKGGRRARSQHLQVDRGSPRRHDWHGIDGGKGNDRLFRAAGTASGYE